MMTLTIRDLRQRWPAAEKALETNDEIIITRDGKAIAKLIKFSEPKKKRPRFDFEKNLREMKKAFGGKLFDVDAQLARDRADRF